MNTPRGTEGSRQPGGAKDGIIASQQEQLAGCLGVKEFINRMLGVAACEDQLQRLNFRWGTIETLADMTGSANTILATMKQTREGFSTLEQQLVRNLVRENINKVVLDITARAQTVIATINKNLYERTADVGFLATDQDIIDFIGGSQGVDKETIIERLKEYRNKYTVYDEIIILAPDGKVLANLNENNSIQQCAHPLIEQTLGTDGYLETFEQTDLIPNQEKSHIFSQKIIDPKTGETIGILCLSFRFTNEMEGIFEKLKTENDLSVMLLLDENGQVIASSDEDHIQVGKKVKTVKEKEFDIITFGGREYIAKTCETKGYQGYMGLGWKGQVMIPFDVAFRRTSSSALDMLDPNIRKGVLSHSKTFCPALNQIAIGASTINDRLKRTVWNGQVMAASGNEANGQNGLKAILKQIRETGQETGKVFDESITDLFETVISSSLNYAQFLSHIMIEFMDRNLFERADDCRWWALASKIREIMTQSHFSSADIAEITEILEYINKLYTVYTRLFVYDNSGKIIAASDLHKDGLKIVGNKIPTNVLTGVQELKTTQDYHVSPFQASPFYKNTKTGEDRHTYIYNAAIRKPGKNDITGGIGIVFDSEPEFKAMLDNSLPPKDGAFALFVDRNGMIISSTDEGHKVGAKIELNGEFLNLPNGQGKSNIIEYKGKYYIVGSTTSSGYREYKISDNYVNDVVCLVFIPIGDIIENGNENTKEETISFAQEKPETTNTEDIATFYVGNTLYGLGATHIIEAVDIGTIANLPGAEKFIAGTIPFYNPKTGRTQPVGIIDIQKLFNGNSCSSNGKPNKEVIIAEGSNGELMGLLVSSLDAVPEIDKDRISCVPETIKEGCGLAHCIVSPSSKNPDQKLLVILNIDEIIKITKEKVKQKG